MSHNKQSLSKTKTSRRATLIVFLSLLFIIKSHAQFYYGSQMEFGKNRVQYNDFLWFQYRYEKFNVYFYKDGQELANYVSRYASSVMEEFEGKMDFVAEGKIKFILFNTLSDLKQSNIGLLSNEQYNVGGITHIIGSKVFLYFDGSYESLEKQIRAGISQALINQMMFGENIGSMMKNAALLSMPEWYVQGLISYMSEEWSIETDQFVRDGIVGGRYEKFNHLTGKQATFAGHSIWYYIGETYGKKTIPNVLYIAKASRNIENGFLYALGVSYNTLIEDWLHYFKTKYANDDAHQIDPAEDHLLSDKKGKRASKENRVFYNIKLSPDGRHLSFISNELGKYYVWLYDLEKDKMKCIKKAGYKLDQKVDYSYPLLSWHPTGKILAMITEEKGKTWLYLYTLENNKFDRFLINQFEKVTSFSYAQNGLMFAMAAVKNGQSDVFVYHISSHSAEQITYDPFDDTDPQFINQSRQIIFSSNRPTDTLRYVSHEDFEKTLYDNNLFLYNYNQKKNLLVRLTNTPMADETKPMVYDHKHFTFLSNENGVNNQFIAHFDSTISYIDTITHYKYVIIKNPVTNYSRSIKDLHVDTRAGKSAEIIFYDGIYRIYVNELKNSKQIDVVNLRPTIYMQKKNNAFKMSKLENEQGINTSKNQGKTEIEKKSRFSLVYDDDSNEIDINNYFFGDDTLAKKQGNIFISQSDTTSIEDPNSFILAYRRNYNTEFNIDKLVTQLDFGFLNHNYQAYNGGPYVNPGLNGFFKVGISDLFEDYRIIGGFRLSTNFDNNEYMVSYENLKHRLDKQWVFHRKKMDYSYIGTYESRVIRNYTHTVRYIIKWPFSQVFAIKGDFFLRNDKFVFTSMNDQDLSRPNANVNWAGMKGALVFDNTRQKGTNIYYGARSILFAEYMRQIDDFQTDFLVLGFDFRHYQKIHRNLIWANRFATSTSLGKQRLVYYLGSVDNWINLSSKTPTFNYDINIAEDQNYVYQTIATNMRGFVQNIRNGNSFALINSEIRWPVFSYFIKKPLRNDFIKNFQIVGFGDVGTAWTGEHPYNEDNSLFKKTITHKKPFNITLYNVREPVVAGYGFGLRSKLLGYFIRADWAWGVEDGYVLPSVFYLSFSLDF